MDGFAITTANGEVPAKYPQRNGPNHNDEPTTTSLWAKQREARSIALGIAVGILFGTILLDNIALGVGVGLSLGLAVGTLIETQRRRE